MTGPTSENAYPWEEGGDRAALPHMSFLLRRVLVLPHPWPVALLCDILVLSLLHCAEERAVIDHRSVLDGFFLLLC